MGPVDEAYQSTSRRDEKPEPTKWEKIELFSKVATVLVAVVGLGTTFYFNWLAADTNLTAQREAEKANVANQALSKQSQEITRAHNEQSVRPYLDFQYRFGISDNEYTESGKRYFVKEGYFRLANIGDGLAIVTKIDAKFDNKDIETSAPVLEDLVTQELKANDFIAASSLVVNQGISPGQYVTLFVFTPDYPHDKTSVCNKDYERKLFATRLKITVHYKSKYKDSDDKAVFDYKVGKRKCQQQTPQERAKLVANRGSSAPVVQQ